MTVKKINSGNPEYIGNIWINRLIDELNNEESNDIELSWYSNGGSVPAGWQLAEHLQSSTKNITANVTGIAASMGAVLLPFFSSVKGASQSWVMLHAPAGGTGKILETVREQLSSALLAKIDDAKLKAITGVGVKEMMNQSGEDRKDYWLTGSQAKEIGLYDELYEITPMQEAENRSKIMNIAASAKEDYGFSIPDKVYKTPSNEGSSLGNQNQNVKKMDINKLKAEHPDLYNQVLALGKVEGVKAESDRVGSFMVFNDVDAAAVKAGIEGGEAMSATQQAEFSRKSVVAAASASVEEEAPVDTPTPQATVVEVDEVTAQANKALDEMGITEPKE